MAGKTPCPSRHLLLELLSPALARASIKRGEVEDGLNLIDTGLLDSLGFLELLAALEDRADITFDLYDADPAVLTTVGGLTTYLRQAQQANHHRITERDP